MLNILTDFNVVVFLLDYHLHYPLWVQGRILPNILKSLLNKMIVNSILRLSLLVLGIMNTIFDSRIILHIYLSKFSKSKIVILIFLKYIYSTPVPLALNDYIIYLVCINTSVSHIHLVSLIYVCALGYLSLCIVAGNYYIVSNFRMSRLVHEILAWKDFNPFQFCRKRLN